MSLRPKPGDVNHALCAHVVESDAHRLSASPWSGPFSPSRDEFTFEIGKVRKHFNKWFKSKMEGGDAGFVTGGGGYLIPLSVYVQRSTAVYIDVKKTNIRISMLYFMHVNKGRLLYLMFLQIKWIVKLNSWKNNWFPSTASYFSLFRSQ